MLRVISCLAHEHDWRLVLLAGAVCFLTSLTDISVFYQARATQGRTRLLWLLTAGAATGYGIWATHFIAMLAYTPGQPVGYGLLLTLVSMLAAMVTTGAGFAVAIHNRIPHATHIGGAIVGLGVGIMHYTGMAGLQIPGYLSWSAPLVLVSILLGAGIAVAALHVATRREDAVHMLGSAVLLTLAIVSLHFTAMGAVEIVPDPTVMADALSMHPFTLAWVIANGAAGVLGISLVAVIAGRSRQRLVEASQAELANQAAMYQTAVMSMSQGLCMFDREQRVIVANSRYSELYGLPPDAVQPGTSLRRILEARIAQGAYSAADAAEIVEAGVASFRQEVSQILHLADGRYISVVRKPLPDGGLVSTHEDITERRRAEAQIAHLAHHDALTDLPNRALLRERLDLALATMRDGGRPFAVLALDLDRFKEVNDTLGHPAGDALLKAVTERLRRCVREGDTVSRLGGDEFVILQRTHNPATDSLALAQRLHDVFADPFMLDGQPVSAGVSIGVAVAPVDGDSGDQLMKNADLALYRAKSDGRGVYRFFQPDMDQKMQERRLFERDLRNALQRDEFVLHYQPLVNAEREEVCGFEALIRWHHPERGLVSPGEFIPVAEETGLIVAIGEWVLRHACAECADWPKQYKIAVNVSPAQFKARNFLDVVVRALARSGMAAERLELEVTESLMLGEDQQAFDTLRALRNLGVRIALDDFGTGYSSLSNLRRFPFDKIKIDRSFVSDLSTANLDALAVVRSVAQLGVSLGMATTAEGVETREQFDQVRAEGCTEIQGYYVCPPSPADVIRERFINGPEPAKAA